MTRRQREQRRRRAASLHKMWRCQAWVQKVVVRLLLRQDDLTATVDEILFAFGLPRSSPDGPFNKCWGAAHQAVRALVDAKQIEYARVDGKPAFRLTASAWLKRVR